MPDRAPCRGGRWADHRQVINGVFWRARAGAPWRDLPSGYGNWKTSYNRHRRWSGDGTWERVRDGLRVGCDRDEAADRTAAIDATIVRAHHHAAGARRGPPEDHPTLQVGAVGNPDQPAGVDGSAQGGPGDSPIRDAPGGDEPATVSRQADQARIQRTSELSELSELSIVVACRSAVPAGRCRPQKGSLTPQMAE